MMELVDMRDLGSRAVMRWGSSPHARTTSEQAAYRLLRLFTKVRARSFRCSSSPNRTRCAGLRFGFGCRPKSCASKVFALSTSRTSYRSRRLFILKSHRSFTPSLLLSNRDSLRWIRGWVWVRGGKSMTQKRSRLCSKNLRLAGGFCCIENRIKTQNAGRTASSAA